MNAVYRTAPVTAALFADADAQYATMKETLTSADFEGRTEAEVERWLAVEQRELIRLFQAFVTLRGQAQAQGPVGRRVRNGRHLLPHRPFTWLTAAWGTGLECALLRHWRPFPLVPRNPHGSTGRLRRGACGRPRWHLDDRIGGRRLAMTVPANPGEARPPVPQPQGTPDQRRPRTPFARPSLCCHAHTQPAPEFPSVNSHIQ